MATAIWRLNVCSLSDLHLNINANNFRDLILSIDVDQINTFQSSDMSTFGVVPVLELQEGHTSWSVQKVKGKTKGVGVMVSGLGAYAKLKGSMEFETRTLETSSTYKEMKKTYGFSAGISSFWSWIGTGTNASYHKEELTRVFNELSTSEKTKGKLIIDLSVTGMYPNVPVSASAYILALEVSAKTGSDIKFSFPVISSGAPTQDTGAKDENDQSVPTKDNHSTIDIH